MVGARHTPAYVRNMLCAALEYGDAQGDWRAWLMTTQADQFLWREREGRDWRHLDREGRARWLTDRLWNSTEVVPARVLALLDPAPAQTYAEVVRRLQGTEALSGDERGDAERALLPLSVYLPRALVVRLRRASAQMEMTESDVVRQALEAWLS